ncbi:serine protease [Streptomyces sp. GESEQ-35]|uniref:serine protease n=1 Tax=Streptomyces sp. GESEQ-35 TaxID=2812657 RepID=UPI001B31CDCA|nr:serine protease [Streptomyces sp. GESEQ-35]
MTPGDSPASRAVVVLGDRQGSGVALNGQLVLTSAHVLGDTTTPEVALPRRTGRTAAQVVWSDAEQDAALLHTADELPCSTHVRVGHLAAEQALPDCEIIGYPDIQRHAGRFLATDQFTGQVLPAAAHPRSVLTFSFDRAPATESLTDRASPLAGLSGAPVFAGDVLLGIVTSIPRGRGHLRAEGVPIGALRGLPYDIPDTEPITRHHPQDSAYERDYARAVQIAFRRMRIFGLDDLTRRETEWDLNTAYLSLEAVPRVSETAARNLDTATTRQPFSTTGRTPQRIDTLLSVRPRVLLRGEAGAGKTTLVWWLAAHTAAGTLGPTLAGLNGLVPFVVPLRTLHSQDGAFPSPAGLPHAARLVVDQPPDGWSGRVLEAGRALLLVDGLDEVPQTDREEAHRWLCALLARYPRTRCVATVRPLAVEPDWLEEERFEELRLLPMRNEDIQTFISSWHRAARLEDDDELLTELEQDLSQQFRHNPALSDLARTPLLCAVICALHRRHQGFLPETRFRLYQAALEMLLGHRDRLRRLDAPDGIAMTVEEHNQILQRIAVWLVRCGQSEFSRDEARPQLAEALAGMERARGLGTPEAILTHLLNRSGLLQERGDDSYQFIHRTFQDFLAAKHLVERSSLGELVRNADDGLWQDVILLAAGHCQGETIGTLLSGLLARADAPGLGKPLRTQLSILTALCAQHAAWLAPGLQERVRARIADLMRSLTPDDVSQVARLGPYVLQFLPDPEELGPARGRAVADLVGRVGGAQAIPYARRLVSTPGLPSIVQMRLMQAWNNFPAAEYARSVLSRIPASRTLPVNTREQLDLVHGLPTGGRLALSGPFTSPELAAARLPPLRQLRLERLPALADLDFLPPHGRHLHQLSATEHASALRDISAVAELPALTHLSLRVPLQPEDLGKLAEIPALTSLTLSTPHLTSVASLPVHQGVERLALTAQRLVDTRGLDAWGALTSVVLPLPLNPAEFWEFVRDSGRIREVDTTVRSFAELRQFGAMPRVRSLHLWQLTELRDVDVLAAVFPSLGTLNLVCARGHRLNADDPGLARLRASMPHVTVALA